MLRYQLLVLVKVWGVIAVIVGGACLLMFGNVFAGSLAWDRNTEADLDHYDVYLCLTPTCTVTKTVTMKQSPSVSQSAVGVVPLFPLPSNTEGKAAVIAVDTVGNESALSVSIPFDGKAPLAPVNPRYVP